MGLGVEHFSRICRACLCESTDMKPLFTNLENGEESLLSLFNSTANLSAKAEDALPKQICSECEMVLHKTEYFRNRCKASDALLKKIIESSSQDKYFDTNSESYKKDVEIELFMDKSSDLEVQDAKRSDIEISLVNPEENEKVDDAADIKMEASDSDTEFEIDFNNESLNTTPIELEEEKPQEHTNSTKNFSYIINQFSCKKCNIPFKDLAEWINHLKSHPGPTKKHVIKTDAPRLFKCSLCFRRCKTKMTLTKHMKLHEETDKVKFSCDKCKREFKFKSFLEIHILSFHMNNNFTCHVCNEKFDSKLNLEVHLDSHKENKKHPCNICGRAFILTANLKEHMRTHTGEKPFLCSTCGKGFAQKSNLTEHTRRHLGVKPFKCKICSKGFVTKNELNDHNRQHTGAQPFVCDDCGTCFATSTSLVEHRRRHTGERPYPCEFCSMRFVTSTDLKKHTRKHTGERPFKCSLCDKAFGQQSGLIKHALCHSDERPYKCSQCDQAFKDSSTLKRHLKTHGKEKEK